MKFTAFLFCDTTYGKAAITMVVCVVFVDILKIKVVSIDAILCTTPEVTEFTTFLERAIGPAAGASSRQGQ